MSDTTLEDQRAGFARAVVSRAFTCANNTQLVEWLKKEHQCKLVGEGSTRRVYGSPLGVCVKIQREDVWSDPMVDDGGGDRGGPVQLNWYRRTANLEEMLFSALHPLLVPKLYGFLASFGNVQKHPSVLIAETCKPLDTYLPGDGRGIAVTDLGIDPESGLLQVFDSRLSSAKMPDNFLPVAERGGVTAIWSGNLGKSPDGTYVFLDRSTGSVDLTSVLSQWTGCPQSWSGTDLEYSQIAYFSYQKALWRSTRKEN